MLHEVIKDPQTTFIDVRSPMEFSMEHIPGALNIPLDKIASRHGEVTATQGPVVLYCQSGNRSGMALSILKQLGLSGIYNGGSIYDLRFLLN